MFPPFEHIGTLARIYSQLEAVNQLLHGELGNGTALRDEQRERLMQHYRELRYFERGSPEANALIHIMKAKIRQRLCPDEKLLDFDREEEWESAHQHYNKARYLLDAARKNESRDDFHNQDRERLDFIDETRLWVLIENARIISRMIRTYPSCLHYLDSLQADLEEIRTSYAVGNRSWRSAEYAWFGNYNRDNDLEEEILGELVALNMHAGRYATALGYLNLLDSRSGLTEKRLTLYRECLSKLGENAAALEATLAARKRPLV
jgi:hypothetical protein